MIFITAMAIGLVAGSLRSAFSLAVVAALIGISFAAAAVLSPGPVSFLALLEAIGGYNAGLVCYLASLIFIGRTETTLTR